MATVLVSGCQKKKELIGRWDMGTSNFYFRKDGVVFYTSPSKAKFQGRYYYDETADPPVVRTEMQEMNGRQRPLTLDLQVTFLSPDRIRFDGLRARSGRNPTMLAARAE